MIWLSILGGVVLVFAGVLGGLIVLAQPSDSYRPTSRRQLLEGPRGYARFERECDNGLVCLDARNAVTTYEWLYGHNPLARHFAKHQRISTAHATAAVLAADKTVISMQAELIKTGLAEQNEIDDLLEERELRPLRREVRVAELKTEAVRHEVSRGRLYREAASLRTPPSASADRPKQPTPVDQAVEKIRRRVEAGLALHEAVELIRRDYRERYQDYPDLLETIEDCLREILEQESLK